MAEEQIQDQISYEIALKLKDLEDSNKLMKERMLLIGKNVIESQEKDSLELTELKKELQNLKSDITRIKSVVESMSEEISKSARKEELAILTRQFKMFEPLEYARIEDIEEIINEKLNKDKEHGTEREKHKFWEGKV